MSYKNITRDSYQSTAQEYARNVADLAPRDSIDKFLKILPSKSKIIDIGCGSGRDAKVFSERGIEVVGIDLCSNLIEIAKKTAPLAEFHTMDMEHLLFSPASFEGAWAATSLLHLPKQDIGTVFRKIHYILKENGYFYVSLKKGAGEGLEKDSRYGNIEKFWSFFEEEELKNILEGAKFKIVTLNIVEQYHPYQTHPALRVLCQKSE